MWQWMLGLFLIGHGLIHAGLTVVPGPQAGRPQTPFWPAPWRTDSNSTWLVAAVGLDNPLVRAAGALLIAVATTGFVLAGLGVLGVPGLQEIWRALAVLAAAAALPLFVLFGHRWLVVGALLEVALLAALLWAHWPPAAVFGR